MFKSAIVLGSAIFCAVLSGMGVLTLDSQLKGHNQAQAADAPIADALPAGTASNTTADHSTAVTKGADGHFWANAVVNARAVRFLVDTGATVVVLTPSDAQRLGFDAKTLTYDRKVMTANGGTLAATVTLSSVGVGESTVHNVDALVVRDGLTTSLLGMSYLGRLSRFEATPSSLILHP